MDKIWSWLTGNVIKEVGGVLDNLITSKEEKLEAKKAIEVILQEAEANAQEQVTRRWESDMKSDSWLSKNTRPMSLIFLTCSLVIFILLDGFEIDFSIDDAWVDLLKSLLITVYVAYFGSRGAEKFKAISKK